MTPSRFSIYFYILSGLLLTLNCKPSRRPLQNTLQSASDESQERWNKGKQWEIRTDHQEIVVPDIFYADKSQNEQLVPTDIEIPKTFGSGKVKYGIDHLIYPTIGNPNLYTREMGGRNPRPDSFLVVLRLDPKVSLSNERLIKNVNDNFNVRPLSSGGDKVVRLQENEELHFYLVKRENKDNRRCTELVDRSISEFDECKKSYFEIFPSKIIKQNEEGLPEVLTVRSTFTFIFDHESMAEVDGVSDDKKTRLDDTKLTGLYDVRVESFKNGEKVWSEFQYNALRVFEQSPDKSSESGEYQVLNFTDTQMSISNKVDGFRDISLGQVQKMVFFLSKTYTARPAARASYTQIEKDRQLNGVRLADFISFNGDLHNGGSPLTALDMDEVINTYRNEAVEIIQVLRELPLPIFLTIGNHDGYASVGYPPKQSMRDKLVGALGRSGADEGLRQCWKYWTRNFAEKGSEDRNMPMPKGCGYPDKGFAVEGGPSIDGKHLNVFQGTFVRRYTSYTNEGTVMKTWHEVPQNERNIFVYDGFNQWRRTYGPTYMSWMHGKNHYINLNTFDLRQHRRTGWGMYTVNYGGGISGFQTAWYKEQIKEAKVFGRDIVILGHHDPRGGHNGHDYPFYFKQVDYKGMGEVSKNYIAGEILQPKLCGIVPNYIKTDNFKLSCLHDGLQEWMRADSEFDCEEKYLQKIKGQREWQRKCDTDGMKGTKGHPFYSGYQLVDDISAEPFIRTLLFGHTHYSSVEVYLRGSQLMPKSVILDAKSRERYSRLASLEQFQNPGRRLSFNIGSEAIEKDIEGFITVDLKKLGHSFKNKVEAESLAILRLTSASNMSSQQYDGQDYYGFSLLGFKKEKGDPTAILRDVTLFQAEGINATKFGIVGVENGKDKSIGEFTIDRSKDIRYKKMSDIRNEFEEDYEYLQERTGMNGENLENEIDNRNPLRRLGNGFKLKTEKSDK
ncbi:MAG: metallophosphoesterase [Bdellovibrionota bacterium]